MLRYSTVLAALAAVVASLVAAPGGAQNVTRKDLRQGVNESTPAPELFLRAYEVFSHPRCNNCHPRDDRPRWGERSELIHGMSVQRGVEQPPGDKNKPEGGYGRPGMTCATCHQHKNGELPGSAPGAINWRLAPLSMGWVGLTAGELCGQFKKLAQDNGREEINRVIEHIVEPDDKDRWEREHGRKWEIDPLVKWAWEPWPGHQRPPGELEQLVQVLTWWKKAGAGCPSK
jgi:hypothetical protein